MEELRFGLGLVEGFYGRQWSDVDRIACLEFIASIGYRYYLYAPKGDTVLRRDWRARWSAVDERRIAEIAACCDRAGLSWGFGLSPLGLVEDPSPANLMLLRKKVRYLERFGGKLHCILFDDMPGRADSLAQRQLDIVTAAVDGCSAEHLLVCPSYYSSDPVLEKLFGAMPEGYWEELGAGLPREAGMFWTGERVCAEAHDARALAEIAARFGRKPVLWDNYPVNDGAKGSNFLRIDAFRGRGPDLSHSVQAHFVNPMNQCWLSRIPLQTLALQYAQGAAYDADAAFSFCARAQCGAELALRLEEDIDALQHRGLATMRAEERSLLHQHYGACASPFAAEIRDWLEGGYAFDPACLTG